MVTRTGTIAAPVLTEADLSTCMGLARKSALSGGSRALATDAIDPIRADLATEAAAEVERYIGRMLFRGPAGAGRQCVVEVELQQPGDVALCPLLPDVSGIDVTIDGVHRWDEGAEMYVDAEYQRRPAGMVRLAGRGDYRLTVTLTPPATPETWAVTATGRLFSWRDIHRTGMEGGGDGGPAAMPASGGMLKSGAASVLRQHRRQWPV